MAAQLHVVRAKLPCIITRESANSQLKADYRLQCDAMRRHQARTSLFFVRNCAGSTVYAASTTGTSEPESN
jgi:hypothetical protein